MNRSQAKLTAKLLKALVKNNGIIQSDGTLRISPASGRGRPFRASQNEWRELISTGLAAREGQQIKVNPGEAERWLRRFEAGDANPYRQQHSAYIEPKAKPDTDSKSRTLRDENPVAWLFRRAKKQSAGSLHSIGRNQVIASEQFRTDFEIGNITLGMKSNWLSPTARTNPRRGAGVNEATQIADRALSARGRFQDALSYVGPEFAPILVSVCCRSESLEQIERQYDWPRRSAKIVLGLALHKLTRYYGIEEHSKDKEILG